MNEDDRTEAIARFLEARKRPFDGDATDVSDEPPAEVRPLIEVAELLWEVGHGAPELESDPVAAMLGLIPDPRYTLDRAELSRARRNARLDVGELVNRLTARGWDVRRGDVFRWETQSAADVSPALIRAIAEETNTDSERLAVSRPETDLSEVLAAVVESPRFTGLVERWMRIHSTSSGLAASTLKSRALATVHRGDRPDTDQLLASLEVLVAALEAGGGGREPR